MAIIDGVAAIRIQHFPTRIQQYKATTQQHAEYLLFLMHLDDDILVKITSA